jgi:hypothetical protein
LEQVFKEQSLIGRPVRMPVRSSLTEWSIDIYAAVQTRKVEFAAYDAMQLRSTPIQSIRRLHGAKASEFTGGNDAPDITRVEP